MKKVKAVIVSLVAVFAIGVVSLGVVSQTALASPADQAQNGVNSVGGNNAGSTLNQGIKNIINVLLYVIGSVAVIMIVIGGLRYVLSGGDSSSTKGAKDTILYAVVGLVVAIFAYAIVNFVITAFTPPPAAVIAEKIV